METRYTVCRRPWCFQYMAWIFLSFESVFPLVFWSACSRATFFSAIPLVFTLCERHSIMFYDKSPLFVNAETTCVLAFWLRSSNFFEVLSESFVVWRNVNINPHPNPAACVASNMCASARNVNIPPTQQLQLSVAQHPTCMQAQGTLTSPPPQPSILRSIQLVCKCKER